MSSPTTERLLWLVARVVGVSSRNRSQATFNPLLSRLADVHGRLFGIQAALVFGGG
jgi:hypothetical protein